VLQDSIYYNVGSNIALNDPNPTFCEDVAGGGTVANVDISTYQNAVFAGATSYNWPTVSDSTNVLITDGDSINIQVQQGSCPTVDIFVHFTINPLPESNPVSMEMCDEGIGSSTFDLTTLESAINGGNGNAVTWYTDNTLGTTIASPTTYSSGNGLVYAEVTDGTTSCTDTAQVTLIVNPLPAVSSSSINMCDEGGNQAAFDLTSVEGVVNTGIGDTVVWYTNNQITTLVPTPSSYLTSSTIVYAQVIDTLTGCSDTVSVVLTVDTLPTANTATINMCDEGSGTATFDLTSVESTVNGGNGNSVNWYEDALASINITTPGVFVAGNDTVYAVVTDAVTFCTDTAMTYLIIDNLPIALDDTFSLCEDVLGSGVVGNVNLTLYDGTINGVVSDTVVWHDGSYTVVPNPLSVTITNNDVFYAIVDNGTCVDTAEVTFEVGSTISPSDPTPVFCEDVIGSGSVANVDLTSYESSIYSGTAPVYNWYTDAGLTTPVSSPGNITITDADTFYVDVTDGNCNNNTTLTFTVNPQFFVQETDAVCSGGSYTFPDGTTQNNITTTVVYNSTLQTTQGCDSIVETTVNVNPALSINPDPVPPICLGDPLILTATASGNGIITWYDTDGITVIGTGSPFDATAYISSTGTYTFYVSEEGDCASGLSSVNVVVGGVTASFTASPQSGFVPLDVEF
ncbi:MAG: hypothetical protein KDD24_09485, partial [Flavobacteriales bacterium]|nr:hypothetical protein [Flavobacteriales bacterium]